MLAEIAGLRQFRRGARERSDGDPMPLLVQVPDDVERPDLAAALRRIRDAVADEEDVHAASFDLRSAVTASTLAPSR